ncbi:asparagine synthase (glutamine-hydrolyzing) [Nonomuraea sp. N2-4H]|uniref:asparagine synthase (glutamine-hydrolyzing) n=1 Tax=unclassified Nonomuraea TaxID=2593643 RepID=UPI003253D783
MCGLAGIAVWDTTGEAETPGVKRMLDAMAHRGPDGSGLFSAEHVCMGTVRLAIVDPEGSDQPLSASGADVHLVFNGEIYNYRELRERLERRGHTFKTGGDGEVILAAYLEDPEHFAARLDGMFAFALWDGRRRRLLLGRDRCGIKPLYYWADRERVVFASEAKALLTDPAVPLAVNRDAIADYIAVRFPLPPGCAFDGVRKVAPGTLLEFGPGARSGRERPFHVLDVRGAPGPATATTLAEALRGAVETTGQPGPRLGLLLSGGLDSTTLTALGAGTAAAVDAYSVGYENATWQDETGYAREVARHVGAEHKVTVLGTADLLTCFLDTLWHLEEPIYTPVCLSTFAVTGLAARDYKSVLAGDGSDELLLGYAHMHRAQQEAALGRPWQQLYWDALGWLSPDDRKVLLDEDMAGRCEPAAAQSRAGFTDAVAGGTAPADAIREFETVKKLPEYHLLRVDRLSMAHSLEVRVPFLRNDVVAWALSHSAGDLMRGEPKQPLRDLARHMVPRHIVDRPKQKFSAPAASWLAGPLRPLALDLLHDGAGAEELGLSRTGLRRLATAFHDDPATTPDITWGVVLLLGWYRFVFERLGRTRAERQTDR